MKSSGKIGVSKHGAISFQPINGPNHTSRRGRNAPMENAGFLNVTTEEFHSVFCAAKADEQKNMMLSFSRGFWLLSGGKLNRRTGQVSFAVVHVHSVVMEYTNSL